MSYKKIAIFLLFILPIMLISLTGCNSSETKLAPTESTQTISPQPTTDPFGRNLTIFPPPKLGQTAELTFTVNLENPYNFSNTQSLTNARTWVEFYWTNTQGSYSEAKQAVPVPFNEVLVSGDLSWEGNALTSKTIKLSSTIQLPREGIWKIMGYFSGEGWDQPADYRLTVAVTKDAAAIMSTDDFKSGPLAYLGDFPYGETSSHKTMNDLTAPVIVEMNISKAPRVGEEANLSCLIESLHDVSDFSALIRFGKRMADNSMVETPGADILVQGDLEWAGDLRQGQPVEFSATIRFPEEGDWWISAGGISAEDKEQNRPGFWDGIEITVTSDRQYFGWEELPETLPPDYKKPISIEEYLSNIDRPDTTTP